VGNKVQYDQELVNDNLTNTFEMVPMENNQEISEVPAIKKKGRGGPRPNSGRKLGSTQKLSGLTILDAIAKIDKPFAEGLAEDYYKARISGDSHLIQRYQQMFLNKVVADKQELDVTSNGQTLGASFTFPTLELPDWSNEPVKH